MVVGNARYLGLTAYQSAKWAVGGFSLGLAQEVAPFGVKVTVLEPGGMRTDWAGPSMTVPPISEPYSADPDRVAAIIAGLAGRDDAPLRILLGEDALRYWDAASAALAESDARWRSVSVSAWN